MNRWTLQAAYEQVWYFSCVRVSFVWIELQTGGVYETMYDICGRHSLWYMIRISYKTKLRINTALANTCNYNST